jgi:hypothetical protein
VKRLPWVLLAILAAAFLYGFFAGRLYAQQMWMWGGGGRFLWFAGAYWAAAGVCLWFARRWFLWAAAAFAVLYSAWFAGWAAPAAALYLLASCYCLGRWLASDWIRATLLGAGTWMALIWTALHFPVNRPWIYAAALAVPIAVQAPRLLPVRFPAHAAHPACSLLAFVLAAHWLVALMPEISSDGLSMHLALPMAVARDGRWAFDFQHSAWALMPAGADSLYTGAYLLGGETAARLLNFAFLLLTAAGVKRAAQRWVSPGPAWLAAALFASTPLVQLVTGSLFVENVWAAFVLGSALALLDYQDHGRARDLAIAAALAGAALAVKLIAGAFALPLLAMAAFEAARRKHARFALAAALLFAALAAPPYLYAWARSGNPVYPFLNAVFRSPHYDASENFRDTRYAGLRLSWTTPYDLTFHSERYIEGQGGAAGFQYWLLLLPAAVLARRRDQTALLGIAAAGALIVLALAPNLRYLYAALPLASVALAWLVPRAPRGMAAACVALVALNLWFLPSSGWYNNGFAHFRPAENRAYVEQFAPVRVLIGELNRMAPGQPAAFFSTDAVAGLRGRAYNDTWHSEAYWERVRNAPDPAAIAAYLRELNIAYVVAPVSREAGFEVVRAFLERWLDPTGTAAGGFAIFRLRTEPVPIPRDTRPFEPGRYDDSEPRIQYSGAWLHDTQFAEPWNRTLTYSDTPGDTARFTFRGSSIAYVHTKAANRGTAEIRIDGRLHRVNLHSPRTRWQASTVFGGLGQGEHTFELRVGRGGYADLDAFIVDP